MGAIFPPENTISAQRISSFARHLAVEGHDVNVITRMPRPAVVGIEKPSDSAFRVIRFTDPLARAEGLVKSTAASPEQSGLGTVVRRSAAFRRAKGFVVRTLLWPDRFSYWARNAYRGVGAAEIGSVIVASGPPLSALVLAARLSRRFGVPWVADYRDLISFGPYSESGKFRNWIERRIEQRVLNTAAAVVTVSEPLAADLRKLVDVPVQVVMNGFEPSDFEELQLDHRHDLGLALGGDNARYDLVLTYCGEIYHEKRDPTPLFDAVAILAREGVRVRLRFFGNSVGLLSRAVAERGIADLVELSPRVPRETSLKLQVASDALLMLMWNDPAERGTFSGKIFEYLGAGRPILMLGFEAGVAAEFIRARNLGTVENDPKRIADTLRAWAALRAKGPLPATPRSGRVGMSRADQARRLEALLTDIERRRT